MSQKKAQVREKFRVQSHRRDKYRCAKCKTQMVGLFDVHHITNRDEMPFGGYVKENGITLCPECHIKAEKWHESGGTEWEEGYHPDDLYKIIGSSFDEAIKASLKLNPFGN